MPDDTSTPNQHPDYVLDSLDTDGKTEIYRSPKGAKYVPYDRFKAANDAAKAAIGESAATVTAAQAAASASKVEADKARAEVVDWQLRAALQGQGITDPEDIAEFRDRWSRALPDEAGKKPTAFEWANKIATTPPKWAQGYFGAPPPAQVAPPAETPAAPPATYQQVAPPPAPRVNNGTQPAPPPPAGRLTDAQVFAMTPQERIASADRITGGQAIKNPQLRRAMGLPPLPA